MIQSSSTSADMLPVPVRIMSTAFLLSLLLLFVVSVLGGLLPLLMRSTHRGMQISLSFVSGIMIGVTVFHLLPDAAASSGEDLHEAVLATGLWGLVGFLAIFLLERFICFHHHAVPDEDACCEHSHTSSWIGALVGLSIHGLLAGLAFGAAVSSTDDGLGVAGLGLLVAIVFHKPFDSLTLGTLLAADGRTRSMRNGMNLAYALVTPVGAIIGWAGISGGSPGVTAAAIAFAAGMFLCIALCDLLPELQFHRHDRLALTSALLLGLALSWGSTQLVEHRHDHEHEHELHDEEVEEHDHAGLSVDSILVHGLPDRSIVGEIQMEPST